MDCRTYRSSNLTVDKPPLSTGIAAGCPFCVARIGDKPAIGKRILFLTSGDSGQIGTRIDDRLHQIRLDQFSVKMQYETRDNVSRVVGQFDALYLIEPFAAVPEWMVPLSIQDAHCVHENMLLGFDEAVGQIGGDCERLIAPPLAAGCWIRRLPLLANDIWPMLEAHNIRVCKEEFTRLFNFGVDLLARTQGRPPVKRKRMPPFAHGKYLTSTERKHWVELFGHD